MPKPKPKAAEKVQDETTARIYAALKEAFPTIPDRATDVVYRYNPVAVRVRVISPRFGVKSTSQREQIVRKALARVPKEDVLDISLLLMLTPDEAESGDDLMSREFDDPTGRYL